MAEAKYYALIPQTTTHSKKLNSLPLSARWLYAVMVAERGGLQRPFKMSYKKIEKITGMNPSTIRIGIKLLDSNDFLDYEHGGLEKNPNLYTLNERWLG